jgi:hypothetical protein
VYSVKREKKNTEENAQKTIVLKESKLAQHSHTAVTALGEHEKVLLVFCFVF